VFGEDVMNDLPDSSRWARILCLIILSAGLLSACGNLARRDSARVSERCTSLSSVLGKNYRISADADFVVARGGGGFERSGTVLTSEAAERQIQLDRLCRTWATGGMTDEEWSSFYRKYMLASLAIASRDASPEGKQNLEAQLDEIKEVTAEVLAIRGGAASDLQTEQLMAKMRGDIEAFGASETPYSELRAVQDKAYGASETFVRQSEEGRRSNAMELVRVKKDLYQLCAAMASAVVQAQKNLSQVETSRPSVLYKQITVYFPKGSFELSSSATTALSAELRELLLEPVNYEIIGYTDQSGSPIRNRELSTARAQEVREFLMRGLEVPARAIVSFGHQHGVDYFGSPEKNRVAVVRVLKVPTPTAAALFEGKCQPPDELQTGRVSSTPLR